MPQPWRLVALLVSGLAATTTLAQKVVRDQIAPDSGAIATVSTLADLEATTELGRLAARILDLVGPPLQPGGRPQVEDDGYRTPTPDPISEYSPKLLRQLEVCFADAVAYGRVASRHVFLSLSGTGLITMNRVDVLEWIEPTAGPDALNVIVRGGRAVVNGVLYQSPHSLPRLRANTQSLMALRSTQPGINLYIPIVADPVVSGELRFFELNGSPLAVIEQVRKDFVECEGYRKGIGR